MFKGHAIEQCWIQVVLVRPLQCWRSPGISPRLLRLSRHASPSVLPGRPHLDHLEADGPNLCLGPGPPFQLHVPCSSPFGPLTNLKLSHTHPPPKHTHLCVPHLKGGDQPLVTLCRTLGGPMPAFKSCEFCFPRLTQIGPLLSDTWISESLLYCHPFTVSQPPVELPALSKGSLHVTAD